MLAMTGHGDCEPVLADYDESDVADDWHSHSHYQSKHLYCSRADADQPSWYCCYCCYEIAAAAAEIYVTMWRWCYYYYYCLSWN